MTFRCGAIVLSVVIGTPRPDNKIEQNAISTPFLCPFINNRLNKRYIINPFPWEIEKHKIYLLWERISANSTNKCNGIIGLR